MTINAASTEIIQNPVYQKKEIEVILNESKDIDTVEGAKEILKWIANNVEEFIDNQRKIFKLDLVLDAEDGATETMPNIRLLQDLYRAIPEDPVSNLEDSDDFDKAVESLNEDDKDQLELIQNCRKQLDEVSQEIHKNIKNEDELLNAIFKRMIFYYEIKGVNNGILLLQELEGEVDVIKFEYESFPVEVKVASPIIETENEDGILNKEGGDIVTHYVIPEGFTVWLEIAFKTKQEMSSSIF